MLFLVSLTTYGPGRVRLTTTTKRYRRDDIQAAGFDPDTIDPSAEVRSLQDKKLSLSQKRRSAEDALTMKGMKTASKARKQITDETSGVEDSLLTPLRDRLEGLLSSIEGVNP